MNLTPETMTLLRDCLIAVGVALIAAGAVLIPYHLRRRRKRPSNSPERVPQGDLANMMILLQTMRDILSQQKDLARQVNESLDGKVVYIKNTVDTAMKDLDTLRRALRTLAQGISKANATLVRLQEKANQAERGMRSSPYGTPPALSTGSTGIRPATAKPQAHPTIASDGVSAKEISRIEWPDPKASFAQNTPELPHDLNLDASTPDLASPAPSGLLDNWPRSDLHAVPTMDTLEPFDEPAPGAPENPETAREAFRALLNMDETQSAPKPVRPTAPPSTSGGNGRNALTPIQARVYEYHDAGMTISQIASELGVGKGEVRLILSIRKDRS